MLAVVIWYRMHINVIRVQTQQCFQKKQKPLHFYVVPSFIARRKRLRNWSSLMFIHKDAHDKLFGLEQNPNRSEKLARASPNSAASFQSRFLVQGA